MAAVRQQFLSAVIFLLLMTSWAYAGNITVNSLEDTNTRDDAITLREAILLSDGRLVSWILTAAEQAQVSTPVGRGTNDTINFGISGTIMPTSGLPDVTDDGTVIDASSWWNQPGLVILDGTNAGNVDGLVISGADNCYIRGLFITSFSAGVLIHSGAQFNTVGGTERGNRNTISGNSGSGVIITGSRTDNNAVKGNYVGTDVTGSAELGNTYSGISINSGAQFNTIGGTTDEERNIISGNDTVGVAIFDSGTDKNVVSGNYIGTTVKGTTALGNWWAGVQIANGAQSNIIGGTTPGERNIISGNDVGVSIGDSGTAKNVVLGNYIGTDVTGVLDLGNSGCGVEINGAAQFNTVGGTGAGHRNIISGNDGHGIWIGSLGTDNNIVKGNYIGTDVTGTVDLGNSGAGIDIRDGAQFNTIGGTTAGERNIISGNDWWGMVIGDSGTDNNVIKGNYIGTDVGRTAALGNSDGGLLIVDGAQHNIIGGTETGNIIAFNGGEGITVLGADTDFNTISRNSIHENVGLGIGLSWGGNDGIVPPDIVWCSLADNILTISGDDVRANATVEVFRADFPGQEGQTFLGNLTVDESGELLGSLPVVGEGISAEDVLVVTITDANGNTSEFSPPFIWTESAAIPPALINIDGRKLSVGEEGILYCDGIPFRAIGVNCHDAFDRTLSDDTTCKHGFAQLAAYGIPFVRFRASGFWPSQLAMYENDRDTYLEHLDGVIQAAEDYGIGLVPSFFWAYFTVPDLVGETVNQWGNPDSKTIAFMRRYTRDIVSRYKDSSAIWVWEFGNEFSLMADLPNAAEHRPPIIPELGTPLTRGPEDDLTTDMIVVAFREFAEVVRSIDPTRPITTGNSVPRSHAEDMRLGYGWSELDTRDEFKDNVSLVNPSPHDMVSIHLYPEEVTHQRFASGYYSSYSELISLAIEAAVREEKSLFVGEFGANDYSHGGPERAAQMNQEMLDALVENNVALAAIWDYDAAGDLDNPASKGWNITAMNSRSYLLDAIRDANEAISHKLGGDQYINYPWDVNGDGKVDVSDLVFVARYFGQNATASLYLNPDLNGDGTVDMLDVILVGNHFGETYPPAASPQRRW